VESAPHASVVALNAAAVAFVDDLLRLPSSTAAATVVTLLYGVERQAPLEVLSHVNGGIHVPLAALLASPAPLAHPLPERLRVGSAWRGAGQALRGARAAARARYRELQAAFVASARGVAQEPAASLVRYTYGTDGRHWLWAETAARVLHRMTALNRAVLGVLAALARGERGVGPEIVAEPITMTDFDLPEDVLDLMAAALPPLAVPAWSRFATALHGSGAPMAGDEATARYQSLLAEILGLGSGPMPEMTS
jgi:hypothetical protein